MIFCAMVRITLSSLIFVAIYSRLIGAWGFSLSGAQHGLFLKGNLQHQATRLWSSNEVNDSPSLPESDKLSIKFDLDEEDPEYDKKMAALELLDVLTSTDDEDDPAYDVNKDIRRDTLLMNNDYHELKLQLRKKGLKTGGDKEEMIARLLLHVIDPTINYMEATGREPNLSYIHEDDLAEGKVQLVPKDQRNKVAYNFNKAYKQQQEEEDEENENSSIFTRRADQDFLGIDADDVKVLKLRRSSILASSKNQGGSGGGGVSGRSDSRDQVMMDGLTRQEIAYKPLCVIRTSEQTHREDNWGEEDLSPREGNFGINKEHNKTGSVVTPYIRAYIVGGRDVLRTWERNPTVVVLLPDVLNPTESSHIEDSSTTTKPTTSDSSNDRQERERKGSGWRGRGIRVMADELAFNMQCIVMVPDLARGLEVITTSDSDFGTSSSSSSGGDDEEEDEGEGGEDTVCNALKKRLFDDIVSTLHYARETYNSESISIAGSGSGGGLALEVSCDLYNMACLSKIYELDDFSSSSSSSTDQADSDWVMCGGLWTQQGRMSPQPPVSVPYLKALAEHKRRTGTGTDSEEPFTYLESYLGLEDGSLGTPSEEESSSSNNNNNNNDDDDDDDDDGDSDDWGSDDLDIMADSMLARLMAEHSDCVPTDEDEDEDEDEDDEPQVIEGHASSYFSSEDKHSNDNDIDTGAVSEGDVKRALARATKKENDALNEVKQKRKAMQELLKSMKLEEKREIAAITRRADEVAATKALTRNILSPASALSLTDIPELLPRALFLVNPSHYDSKKVQQELRLPSFFVFGCDQEQNNGGTSSSSSVSVGAAADLLFTLKKRRHEIVDFCIRQYEGVKHNFLLSPDSAEDAVCGQEALIIGSSWLDVYSRRLVSRYRAEVSRIKEKEENRLGLVEGGEGEGAVTGGNNDSDDDTAMRDGRHNQGRADFGYTEDSQVLAQTKFDTPFVRINAEELGGTAATMALLHQQEREEAAAGPGGGVIRELRRPSPVATFLHDDDQLYREDPKEGFEYQSAV